MVRGVIEGGESTLAHIERDRDTIKCLLVRVYPPAAGEHPSAYRQSRIPSASAYNYDSSFPSFNPMSMACASSASAIINLVCLFVDKGFLVYSADRCSAHAIVYPVTVHYSSDLRDRRLRVLIVKFRPLLTEKF